VTRYGAGDDARYSLAVTSFRGVVLGSRMVVFHEPLDRRRIRAENSLLRPIATRIR
jgi:hypothetical protein